MTKAEIVEGLRQVRHTIPFSHAHHEVLEAAIAALSAEERPGLSCIEGTVMRKEK